MIDFERRLLLKIGFQVIPQATPSAFLRHIISLWPESSCPVPVPADDILITADKLVGQFWKDAECLCYAPTTIAIAALLLTFSKYKMNCTEWLKRLPDECFPPKHCGTRPDSPRSAAMTPTHAIFPDDELDFLNVDACILAMQRVAVALTFTSTASPSSISSTSSVSGSPFSTQHTESHSECPNEIQSWSQS